LFWRFERFVRRRSRFISGRVILRRARATSEETLAF